MSGCSILWQQPVKMFHLSSGDPFVLCVCICVCVWAFGSSCMSGCSILRQQPVKMSHLSSGDPFVLCVCVCVWASGSLCMSGCSILWQQPVKMFHLSSGDLLSSVCVYVCVSGRLGPRVCQDAPSFGNSLSRCSIFRQVTPFVLCVCVWAFGSLCMSGCSILWQQPVKMFHLSSGDLLSSVCVCVSGRLGPRVCQDAPSFGNSLSRCSIFRQVTLLSSVCLSTSRFVCVCQHLCVSEGDGWVYIQCICFVSVTKTRDFF